jgi:hypothetical protein
VEIFAVCSEIHTKPVRVLCKHNVAVLKLNLEISKGVTIHTGMTVVQSSVFQYVIHVTDVSLRINLADY